MSNDLEVKKDIVKEHDLSVIEQVVMQGNLAKLTPLQRVTYYHKVCESLGLNPYTRPFDYIDLNGKLTLYAKKDATEQLRQVKRISIIALEGRVIDDLYIVVAKASTQDGRIDQATGAVNIGSLKGEAKANAIMKAETKAKRRVTLSISGMGWTDESEIESIPHAMRVNVDISTGEITETDTKEISYTPQPPAAPIAETKITRDQAAIMEQSLLLCPDEFRVNLRNLCKQHLGSDIFIELPASQFDNLMKRIKGNQNLTEEQRLEEIHHDAT